MPDSLEQRRIDNVGTQIDNVAQPAGTDLYYYCHGCGAETAVKPENWVHNPPPRFCDDCEILVDRGEMDPHGEPYDDWLAKHNHPRVPR